MRCERLRVGPARQSVSGTMGFMCSPVRFSHHLSLSNSLKWEGLNTMHNFWCQRNFVCSARAEADASFARLNSLVQRKTLTVFLKFSFVQW